MRKKQNLGLAIAALALAAATSGRAQPYSNAVAGLNPVAYWPLNETTQPPFGAYIATNLGTAGVSGNGYYESWFQPSGTGFYQTNNIQHIAGAIGDGDQALSCTRGTPGTGNFVVFPRTTGGVANPTVTLVPPFSIEFWAFPNAASNTVMPIINEGRAPVTDATTGYLGNNEEGFSIGQYGTIFFFASWNNRGGDSTKQELDAGLTVGAWQHMVLTFDGTNQTWFKNGVQVAQRAIPNSAANSAGQLYTPDLVSPLLIGTGSIFGGGNSASTFGGGIDEVAIYTNILDAASIQAHYNAATATDNSYSTAVLGNNPAIYLRLDEPAFNSYPSPSSYPVANNYGLVGATANGAYQPGTVPGVPGPSYAGFGSQSMAVALNGAFGAVDIGGGALPPELNPTNNSAVTVTAWVKGNPADSAERFQEIVSHGNSSWRMTLDNNSGVRFNPGNGPELQFTNTSDVVANGAVINDGNWHFIAGVSDGTNDSLYVDGALLKTGASVGAVAGSTLDALLGGSPQSQVPVWNGNGSGNQVRNFDGQLSQVAIFTNALTSAQIQQLYSAAAVPVFIVQQPQSATNNAGDAVTLSVNVRGTSPFTYQWYKNGSPVSGATTSSLSFNPIAAADAAAYYVTVGDSLTSVTSSTAQLTVYSIPVILQQTASSVQVFSGSSPTFHVTAAGPSLTYAWTLNGSPISGATSSSYTATNIQASGSYVCTVANSFGSTPSAAISVTVLTPPAVTYPANVVADKPLAYYRLNESSGTTAFDYVGGLNATYTNVSLGQSGYSSSDPSETSVAFGPMTNSFAGWVPSYLNFGAPAGTNSAFSVEAWVNGGTSAQSDDAGLVTLGYGNGGEQFNLDLGASDPKHNYRFFVRTAAGTVVAVNGTNAPTDGNWHHVVAVCDQPHSNIFLYVDGVLEGKNSISATAGILKSSIPMSIGSRQSGFGTAYDNQLTGNMDDVAIYGYALSSAQVANHYYSVGVAPIFTLEPTNTTVNFGANAYFYAGARGTAPLAYQWYDISTGTAVAVPSATNSTLVISNVTDADNNRNFYLVVTNSYGEADSYYALLSVLAGPPFITGDITPLFAMGYAGTPYTYTVTASGSAPFSYVWTLNGTAIAGATNSSYSFNSLVGTNAYQVTVKNTAGTAVSSIATNIGFAAPTLTSSDYTYKMKITFAGYNKPETLVDFPALVQIGTNLPDFSYSQLASPTGGDLRFTDASGTREIPYEIDEWNPNGVSSIWVQVPALSGNTNFIWAYWGNPAATTPEAWSTNGEVWVPAFNGAPAYKVVYHLKEAGFPYADSTTQHNSTNGVAAVQTNGVVGTAQSFDGSMYLDAGTNDLGSQFTASAWVNIPTGASDIKTLWANQVGGFGSPGFALFVDSYQQPDRLIDFATGIGNKTGSEAKTATGVVSSSQWHLISVAVDQAAGAGTIYLDGQAVPLASGSFYPGFTNVAELFLGSFASPVTFGMQGFMDEARISGTTNSANWVWADYMTVAQNSTFESYSAISSSTVTLTANKSGDNLILTWPQGTLQSAGVVNGNYTNITTATSPYSVPLSGAQQYFRVKVK